MSRISYRGYRFPPEIIQRAVWLYFRFTLGFVTLLGSVEPIASECHFRQRCPQRRAMRNRRFVADLMRWRQMLKVLLDRSMCREESLSRPG